ncbi:putative ribonuclease H-like domain-containing protein, partial [Tanacetum coccineum]
VKSAFLYGKIDEEVYVSQPPGFKDPKSPEKVYKVVKALYGLHQAPKAWSMIGSLMYVTTSRPDIMFAVCACSRFQVTPKTSHLSAVKRIFRYLKGKPKLGLWYPRVSSFNLESYSDSDYAGANLDRKSTTGGCQFLGRRLITWQCKKQTIVATSTTKAEYVAAASCCGQVLWIQNQMLDYGFNFMNTKIYIDNESTICIVKNPVYHSKTKHIAIRHHFIRDAYEKKLIQQFGNLMFALPESVGRVVRLTKRRVYVMFDNKGDAYHWSGVYQADTHRHFSRPSASKGFFGSSNLMADPDAVSMIQTASYLSPDAVRNIPMASSEPGLKSSSIFIPVSYLVRFLPKLSPNHVWESLVEGEGKVYPWWNWGYEIKGRRAQVWDLPLFVPHGYEGGVAILLLVVQYLKVLGLGSLRPHGYKRVAPKYGNPTPEALHPSQWAFDKTRVKVRQSNPRSLPPSRSSRQNRDRGSGYQQKDRKPSQNDKTEHGMEKTVQNQGQSPKMPKSESILKNQQSNRSRN